MERKRIGGATVSRSDLQSILTKNKEYLGILLKIPNPLSHEGVGVEVYGALISKSGISEGQKFPCQIGSCSIAKDFENSDIKTYEYEHSSQFSHFSKQEPLIAFFSRIQIEILFSLGEFDKLFVYSYQINSTDPLVNPNVLSPNFGLAMQPLVLPNGIANKTTTFSGFGLPQSIIGATCPRTWTGTP